MRRTGRLFAPSLSASFFELWILLFDLPSGKAARFSSSMVLPDVQPQVIAAIGLLSIYKVLEVLEPSTHHFQCHPVPVE